MRPNEPDAATPGGCCGRPSPILQRHQSLLKLVLRFLIGGGFNTAATLILYWLLLRFIHYQGAYLLSYCAGILLSYLLNTCYVFRVRHNWLTFAAFPLVYVVVYALGALTLKIAVDYLHVPDSIGPLASIAVTMPISFLLTRALLQPPEK
ncbi:GtrA family protein [Lysobacter sp. CW239]|uniref:GtrA family protein n=1 Tax=Lysobacteraceae TaxID=32033 RepID=UPI0009FF0B71|nr:MULTISPECIES: GtrA family protein [Lysobacter]QOD91384.1 GtrA family protein [Lysobacter sp. CW239]